MAHFMEHRENSRRLIPCSVDRHYRSKIIPEGETLARVLTQREEEYQMTGALQSLSPFIECCRRALPLLLLRWSDSENISGRSRYRNWIVVRRRKRSLRLINLQALGEPREYLLQPRGSS